MKWEYEGGDCPRYMLGFPFGRAYVESHGPSCRAKMRQGVWTFHCDTLQLGFRTLRAKDGPTACSRASRLLIARLDELSAKVAATMLEATKGTTT